MPLDCCPPATRAHARRRAASQQGPFDRLRACPIRRCSGRALSGSRIGHALPSPTVPLHYSPCSSCDIRLYYPRPGLSNRYSCPSISPGLVSSGTVRAHNRALSPCPRWPSVPQAQPHASHRCLPPFPACPSSPGGFRHFPCCSRHLRPHPHSPPRCAASYPVHVATSVYVSHPDALLPPQGNLNPRAPMRAPRATFPNSPISLCDQPEALRYAIVSPFQFAQTPPHSTTAQGELSATTERARLGEAISHPWD